MTGRGRLVLLAGEPGIGKTRLADELAERAVDHGVRVLWASCWDGDGAPAFWPWIQVMRAYARDADLAAVTSELGAGGADLARLVPELAERWPAASNPAPAADSDRFRLFDAVATLLKDAAETRPIVIILDDLHWSDQPSLQLLRFLARDLRAVRLLVVGT